MKKGQPLKRRGWMRRPKPKPKRKRSSANSENGPWRSEEYLAANRHKDCVFCGLSPSEPCHIRLAGFCGTSQKPADYMVIQACRSCHTKYGDMNHDVDAVDVLRALCRTWAQRMDEGWGLVKPKGEIDG